MSKEKKPVNDGVFIYIGPTIFGVIQTGTIYAGKREDVLKSISDAIEKYPKIERLIVADSELASAKRQIKVGGNALSHAYKALKTTEI